MARNLGLVDALEVSLFQLKPQAVYDVYVSGQRTPVASFRTNAAGAANGTAIGPLREAVSALSAKQPAAATLLVVEGNAPPTTSQAVLTGTQ
ncbi:hypothetical protein D9M72_542550 [compost metagenome]